MRCTCAPLNESTFPYEHVTARVVKECDRTRSGNLCARANSRGLRLLGGIITGRPRLRTAASLSFLFDDVPHHKALNTQMRRLQGGVEMGAF